MTKTFFNFSLVNKANNPGGIPILMNWERQVGNYTTKSCKTSMARIEYSYHNDDDTNSMISLIRDKHTTKIDVRAYSFTEEGCVGRGDIYQTFLFNDVCKYTRFDILNEKED